jgi:hypothetical protein
MCLTEISVIVVDSQADREEVSHSSKTSHQETAIQERPVAQTKPVAQTRLVTHRDRPGERPFAQVGEQSPRWEATRRGGGGDARERPVKWRSVV